MQRSRARDLYYDQPRGAAFMGRAILVNTGPPVRSPGRGAILDGPKLSALTRRRERVDQPIAVEPTPSGLRPRFSDPVRRGRLR